MSSRHRESFGKIKGDVARVILCMPSVIGEKPDGSNSRLGPESGDFLFESALVLKIIATALENG